MKAVYIILAGLVLVGIYGVLKPLPQNLSFQGEVHRVSTDSVKFFADRTYTDAQGQKVMDQEIFDEILRMIDDAQSYILLDFFFFSDFLGTELSSYRPLSQELTDALITKKKNNPDISIQVITDPINTMYGGYVPPVFKQLADNVIPVIVTKLTPLRDSNPTYSAFWRTFVQWFGVGSENGWLPNVLDEKKPKVTLRAYLSSFNFKANHRKVVMADWERGGEIGFSALITSANPHDGSSENSNIAVRIDDDIWVDILASERAVAHISGATFVEPSNTLVSKVRHSEGELSVQLLTEGAIEKKAIGLIEKLIKDDQLDMAMFYISDRNIVDALKKADTRGVKIRLLFDPNKDAFGRKKNGIPNRQVAHELMSHTKGNTSVRWCDTRGEQCHSKLLLTTQANTSSLLQGSANFTRRNLNNFNLETDVYIEGASQTEVLLEARSLFEELWTNKGDKMYSVAYEVYKDASFLKTVRYLFMEFSGMSRF